MKLNGNGVARALGEELGRERLKNEHCKHELVVGTCATCNGDDREVPDPFEGISVQELDPEQDLID